MRNICGLSVLLCLVAAPAAHAQTFFYVGPSGGDFFDEANWNDAADGTGAAPAGGTINPGSAAEIALELVIDGDTVVANDNVDIGDDTTFTGGSLTLLSGSVFNITGAGNDFDYNQFANPFSLTDATFTADGDLRFKAQAASFTGGSVTALTDDIEFRSTLENLFIDGTTFSVNDTGGGEASLFFDNGPASGSVISVNSISNAEFNAGVDGFGMRFEIDLIMTDTTINVGGGLGPVENVFISGTTHSIGSKLTLAGNSSLLADKIDNGIFLILEGNSTATLAHTGSGLVSITPPEESQIILNSFGASLTVVNSIPLLEDPRALIINGVTGLSYAADDSTWNVQGWNGSDPVTLRIVPEPSSLAITSICLVAALMFSRRRQLRSS